MQEICVQLYEKKSKRERILELAKQGMTRKQIAKELQTYYNYVADVLAGRK